MADIFIENMMNRGEYFRFLRQMEKEDEEERRKNEFEYLQDESIKKQDDKLSVTNLDLVKDTLVSSKSHHTFDTYVSTSTSDRSSLHNVDDKVDLLPISKQKVLRYDSYLYHQRYSDDYKHCNCDYVDYPVGDNSNTKRLIVEQQRSLGKGGLIWDAGVVLADYMVMNEKEWKMTVSTDSKEEVNMTRMVELGAGTGLTGMAIAKAVDDTEVTITDLQELLPLMQRNVERNFDTSLVIENDDVSSNTDNDRGEAARDIPRCSSDKGTLELCSTDECVLYDVFDEDDIPSIKNNSSTSKIKASVLRWGVPDDYKDGPYDVIIGGDVVASLYDPRSLAKTIYDLCHDHSHVYLSLNRRLVEILLEFQDAMKDLFYVVDEIIEHGSRRRNTNVFILHAMGKR